MKLTILFKVRAWENKVFNITFQLWLWVVDNQKTWAWRSSIEDWMKTRWRTTMVQNSWHEFNKRQQLWLKDNDDDREMKTTKNVRATLLQRHHTISFWRHIPASTLMSEIFAKRCIREIFYINSLKIVFCLLFYSDLIFERE